MSINFEKLRNLEQNQEESAEFLDLIFSNTRFYVKNHTRKLRDGIGLERKKTFKSLEKFINKKASVEKTSKIVSNNISIKLNKGELSTQKIIQHDSSTYQWYVDKIGAITSLDILFVGDPIRESAIENIEQLNFEDEKWSILSNIVRAMELAPKSFAFSLCFSESDKNISFERQLLILRPKVVITLGAMSTNAVLGNKERLSNIHGKFIEKEFKNEELTFKVNIVPIFHPEFLSINKNMKSTAWVDLQQVIEYLKNN